MNEHVHPIFRTSLEAMNGDPRLLRSGSECMRVLELRYDGPIPQEEREAARLEGLAYAAQEKAKREADPIGYARDFLNEGVADLNAKLDAFMLTFNRVMEVTVNRPMSERVTVEGHTATVFAWRRRLRWQAEQLADYLQAMSEAYVDFKNTFLDATELPEVEAAE